MVMIGNTSVIDLALVVASGIVFLAIVSGLVRNAFAGRPLSWIRSVWADVTKALRTTSEADMDEVDLMVLNKMTQRKIDHMRLACQTTSVFFLLPVMLFVVNTILGESLWLLWQQQAVIIALECALAVVIFFPSVVNWRTINLWYGMVVLGMTVISLPWFCTTDTMMVTLFLTNTTVIFMSLMTRSIRVVLLFHLIFAAGTSSMIIVHGNSGFPFLFPLICLILLVLIPVVAITLDLGIAAVTRGGFQIGAAKEALCAASALLRSCCDVVVELDSAATILSAGIDLGSFLLRGPGYCLQGTRLSELFAYESDKTMFLSKLVAPWPSGVGLAEAIHVRIRDGNDQLLRVELLWFQFHHLDDQPHYMVGIREFTDVQCTTDNPRPQHLQQRDNPELRAAEDLTTLTDAREFNEHRLLDQKDSDAVSLASSLSRESFDEPPALLAIDTHCLGLHIRECSSGFRFRIGRLALGTCFAELVQRRQEFVNWVQAAVNSALNGEDEAPYCVTINMRQGPVKANCRVLRSRPQEEDESTHSFDPEHVLLFFYSIKQCGRKAISRSNSMQVTLRGTPVVHMSI